METAEGSPEAVDPRCAGMLYCLLEAVVESSASSLRGATRSGQEKRSEATRPRGGSREKSEKTGAGLRGKRAVAPRGPASSRIAREQAGLSGANEAPQELAISGGGRKAAG